MSISDRVIRESKTEKKVREMDTHEIVEWIHILEDEINVHELNIKLLIKDLEDAKTRVR